MFDEELIYLYLVAKNDLALTFLYERYLKLLIGVGKKIFNRFFTIPLEWNDLASDIYFIFYNSIYNFKDIKNKSFRNYLLSNLSWGILNYVKKYMSKNHQIINLAFQYQDYLINEIPQYYENKVDFESYNLNLSQSEKNVLQLKQQGFSNQEIMKQLNLSYKQVDNAWQRTNLKLRLLKTKLC